MVWSGTYVVYIVRLFLMRGVCRHCSGPHDAPYTPTAFVDILIEWTCVDTATLLFSLLRGNGFETHGARNNHPSIALCLLPRMPSRLPTPSSALPPTDRGAFSLMVFRWGSALIGC